MKNILIGWIIIFYSPPLLSQIISFNDLQGKWKVIDSSVVPSSVWVEFSDSSHAILYMIQDNKLVVSRASYKLQSYPSISIISFTTRKDSLKLNMVMLIKPFEKFRYRIQWPSPNLENPVWDADQNYKNTFLLDKDTMIVTPPK